MKATYNCPPVTPPDPNGFAVIGAGELCRQAYLTKGEESCHGYQLLR